MVGPAGRPELLDCKPLDGSETAGNSDISPYVSQPRVPKRKPFRAGLTAERLREALSYDSLTGEFRWRVARGRRAAGDVAGIVGLHGYVRIGVDGSLYLAHRLAVLYATGEYPSDMVDHIDNNPANNALNNLRQATRSENLANSRCSRNNRSGFKGVDWFGQKWRARIMVNRRAIWLGHFETPEAAHQAYVAAAIKHFGEYANDGTGVRNAA